jgi:hypothetical protein
MKPQSETFRHEDPSRPYRSWYPSSFAIQAARSALGIAASLRSPGKIPVPPSKRVIRLSAHRLPLQGSIRHIISRLIGKGKLTIARDVVNSRLRAGLLRPVSAKIPPRAFPPSCCRRRAAAHDSGRCPYRRRRRSPAWRLVGVPTRSAMSSYPQRQGIDEMVHFRAWDDGCIWHQQKTMIDSVTVSETVIGSKAAGGSCHPG